MVDPDTQGIVALSADLGQNVSQLAPLIFDGLLAELGELPVWPQPQELAFDEGPWQELAASVPLVPLESLLHELAVVAHGEGPDLMVFLARQRKLAELELTREKVTVDAEEEAGAGDDVGSAGEGGPVVSADPVGGGAAVSGGSEDGDAVGEGGEAVVSAHRRRAPKVSGARRAAVAGAAA